MNWLLAPRIRPCVVLAAMASLLLNLALVVPSLYMLEVFDRVFTSRSLETLAMLTLIALLALALGTCMDRVRALLLARAGRWVDEALSARTLAAALADAATGRGRVDRSAMQDIARLRGFLAGPAVQALFDAPWLPVYLLVIAALHPALGLAALGSAAALFGLGLYAERAVRADTERVVDSGRGAARRIEALARHAEVLVGMGMLDTAVGAWSRAHGDALHTQQRLSDTSATLAAASRALRQLVQIGMLALGAWLVVAGHASPGIMVAATVLLGRALQPVEHLVAGWKSLIEVRGAWQRLQQQAPEDAGAAASACVPVPRGELRLERVTLQPDPQRPPLIKAVSLALEPGQCLALIGPSASGKTTLVRLMLGLRTPHAGAVRLDGLDLAAWPRERLAGAVGYLPQDVELFDGSVAHNIAQLGEVDPERVVAAARLAGAHELILGLPQGYETAIGDAGARLSGGQRQRIALARAVYGQPKLVLLDEPNAHLDHDGEEALGAAIERLKQAGAAVLLVSHRPALLRQADRVALLRDGALEACGPRDKVLAALAGNRVQPLRPVAAAAGPATAAGSSASAATPARAESDLQGAFA